MGVGNGGNTTANIKSSTQGQWEHLIGYNAVTPANEFVLYGQDPKDNEFYADDAVVCDAEDIYALRLCLPLIYASASPSPLLRAPSSLMVRLGNPPCHVLAAVYFDSPRGTFGHVTAGESLMEAASNARDWGRCDKVCAGVPQFRQFSGCSRLRLWSV
jgi:hypothetical protein